jgi:hypothetical protein
MSWCDFVVHAPNEDKRDNIKASIYMELERAFDQVCKYHIQI